MVVMYCHTPCARMGMQTGSAMMKTWRLACWEKRKADLSRTSASSERSPQQIIAILGVVAPLKSPLISPLLKTGTAEKIGWNLLSYTSFHEKVDQAPSTNKEKYLFFCLLTCSNQSGSKWQKITLKWRPISVNTTLLHLTFSLSELDTCSGEWMQWQRVELRKNCDCIKSPALHPEINGIILVGHNYFTEVIVLLSS